jgi:hypothetical protein
LAFVLAFLSLASLPVRACTIFVLTDTNRALFCNNEAGPDTKTRVWFLPAGEGHFGAVYVGYDNGYAQGGMNTEGLAYDWVAGFTEDWHPDSSLPTLRVNPGQRMLETCATVNDAIAFYWNHRVPAFARARILVADKTGASVIIGAKDSKLLVEKQSRCRGFGFGQQTLDAALAKRPAPTVANGFKILRDCRQTGQYTTRYSNIYDLKSGDIFLYPLQDRDDEVKLNLTAELEKGAHYYEMPQIQKQLAQAPLPLPARMGRFPMDELKPIPDKEPQVTAHLRTMIQEAIEGTAQVDDYTAERWQLLLSKQKEIQAFGKSLGDFLSITLVERGEVDGQRSYRYRLEFANAILLEHLVLDGQNKCAAGGVEAVEWKPGASAPAAPANATAGIGVALGVEGESLIVREIVPDSPAAAQKDLHVGDRILAVAQDNEPAVQVQVGHLAQMVAAIRGPKGTTVRLTIASSGENDSHARVVSLVRDELKALAR